MFLPNGTEANLAVTRVVTVPYRAFVLGLSLTVIALNWKRRIRLNLPLRLYFLFWFLLSLRIVYDLFIRTDIHIDPSVVQNMLLYSYLSCLLPAIAIFLSARAIDYNLAFKWILGGVVLLIPLLAINTPDLFSSAGAGVRLTGNIALNPISLGILGVVMTVFGLFLLVRTGWGWRRWLGAALMVIGLVVILRSGSRGPLVVFVSSMLFYAIARLDNPVWIALTSFVMGAFLILGDVIFEIIGRISPIMAWRLTLSGNVTQYEELTNHRNELFSAAFEKFVDHPLFGDAYALVFPDGSIFYSHNMVLDAFMALGLFGGCIFIIILLFATRNSFLLIRHHHCYWWIGLLCVSYIISHMFSGCFYQADTLNALLIILLYMPVIVRAASGQR
jgi:O-antigen ligase